MCSVGTESVSALKGNTNKGNAKKVFEFFFHGGRERDGEGGERMNKREIGKGREWGRKGKGGRGGYRGGERGGGGKGKREVREKG